MDRKKRNRILRTLTAAVLAAMLALMGPLQLFADENLPAAGEEQAGETVLADEKDPADGEEQAGEDDQTIEEDQMIIEEEVREDEAAKTEEEVQAQEETQTDEEDEPEEDEPEEGTYSEEPCISSLATAFGENGFYELEEAGYSVLGRTLCGDVWLGYQKGGTPFTGLVVSSGGAGSVEVDGILYESVCSLGGAGTLYATSDTKAGRGILGFSLQSDDGSTNHSLYALPNDGTVPLRYDSGQPCDLGVNELTYLFIRSDSICRPYISSVTAVSGADLWSAIQKAAEAGNTYYYDPGQKTPDGETIVLGMKRTAAADKALTCLTAETEEGPFKIQNVSFKPCGDVVFAGEKPYRLFASKDRKAGNPIVDLTGSAVPVRSSDVMNKWAEKVFVKFNTSPSAVTQVKGESMYLELLSDSSELTHVPVIYAKENEEVKTPLAYTCKKEGMPLESIFEKYREKQAGEEEKENEKKKKKKKEESKSEEDLIEDSETAQETEILDEAEEILEEGAVEEETEDFFEEEPMEEEQVFYEDIVVPEEEYPEGESEPAEEQSGDGSDIYAASVFGNGTSEGILFGVIAMVAAFGIGFLAISKKRSPKEKEEKEEENDDEETK